VVSSLFSIKAAHWRDGIRGTELGARGKERTARMPRYPRKRLRLTRRRIEHEHEHEHEQEHEQEHEHEHEHEHEQ
jgi:hypothetical protein